MILAYTDQTMTISQRNGVFLHYPELVTSEVYMNAVGVDLGKTHGKHHCGELQARGGHSAGRGADDEDTNSCLNVIVAKR